MATTDLGPQERQWHIALHSLQDADPVGIGPASDDRSLVPLGTKANPTAAGRGPRLCALSSGELGYRFQWWTSPPRRLASDL